MWSYSILWCCCWVDKVAFDVLFSGKCSFVALYLEQCYFLVSIFPFWFYCECACWASKQYCWFRPTSWVCWSLCMDQKGKVLLLASERCSNRVFVATTSFEGLRASFLSCFVNFSTIFNFICCSCGFCRQTNKWSVVSSVSLQKLHLVFIFAYRSKRCFFLFSKVGSLKLINLKRKQLSACSLVEIWFLKALWVPRRCATVCQ